MSATAFDRGVSAPSPAESERARFLPSVLSRISRLACAKREIRIASLVLRASQARFREELLRARARPLPGGQRIPCRYPLRIQMADPHDEKHEEPVPQLGALNFLIGRFRGEGVFTDGGDPYEKDVTRSWVADGHHLLLDMVARYVDSRGRRDEHSAVVVVSATDDGGLTGSAYTDGGEVIALAAIGDPRRDRVCGHGSSWVRGSPGTKDPEPCRRWVSRDLRGRSR